MKKYCFGVDVGGTTIKCGLFQTDGTLLEKWEIPTRSENSGENILPDAARAVLEKCSERGIEKEEVAGVGIGVPGPVNSKGEVPRAVNIYWGYKNVVGEMEQLTGLSAKAGNDANVAALGEAWMGAAKGSLDVMMVTLGTGVGGGIVVDGRIVVGAHGAGGEIGHANVNRSETEACNCGCKGCLEQYASATGLVRLARNYLKTYQGETSLSADTVTAKDIFDACKAGEEAAKGIVEQFSEYLGQALAAYACVVDPEVIVLGGGVSKAGDILVEYVEKQYRKYAFPSCRETPIILAKLGNDAGICGAARLVLE